MKINRLKFCTFFIGIVVASWNTCAVCADMADIDPSSLQIPSHFAEIKETYRGSSGYTVIHIQDAHCIYEAQHNIAKTLGYLKQQYGISLFTMEGAADELTGVREFSSFPHEPTRETVSDYMLKNGRISGLEYFSITHKNAGYVTGLENRELYVKNLDQFKHMLTRRARIDRIFASLERIVKTLENVLYTGDMQVLVRLEEDYQSGRVNLTEYVKNLFTLCNKLEIDLAPYSNLTKIHTIYQIESNLDFEAINQQRRALINSLTGKMDETALRSFLRANMDFKMMSRSNEDFHNYLHGLMADYNVSSAQYPALTDYFRYLATYRSILWEELHKESTALTHSIINRLATSEKHTSAYRCAQSVQLLHDMFLLYLPVYRYEEYLTDKDALQPAAVIGQLRSLAASCGENVSLREEQEFLEQTLPLVEDFYTIARRRDHILVENLISHIGRTDASAAVFVAGGFHTQGITQQLRDRDISYIVLVPRVSSVPDSSAYISMMMDQKNFYELYLGQSTLAIASWLEKNPLSAPERQTTVGYRMKSLMVGAYTYTTARQDIVQAQSDPAYLTGKITELLAQWGAQHYGDLAVTDIRYLGPYLQVAMVVNGKEIIFLFNDTPQEGTATLESPDGHTMDIVFNSSGELNLLEEDILNDVTVQIITPQGLESLLAYSDVLSIRSTRRIRDTIREQMENKLTVLLIENQIQGPEQFQQLLKEHNIGLSRTELSNFFERIGAVYMQDFFHPSFSANRANSTLLGTYLGIKAQENGLYLSNDQLPQKIAGIFNHLELDTMYIEKGIPVPIVRSVFQKISSGEIKIVPGIIDFYMGADERNSYYISVLKQPDDTVFVKLETAPHDTIDDVTGRIDPSVLDMILAPAIYQTREENIIPISRYEPGITFIEVTDTTMSINLVKVTEDLHFHRTDIKLVVDLETTLPNLDNLFSQIEAAAAENGIHLLGVVMNNPELTGGHGFFNGFDDFISAYYSFTLGLEVNKRLSQQHNRPISVRVVSNNQIGEHNKITFSNIVYRAHDAADFDLITERLAPTAEGYQFNIGLGEFLEDRQNNLKPSPVKFEPVTKLIFTFDDTTYVLGKGHDPSDIRLLLENNQYSPPLGDGDVEFIHRASRLYYKSGIEHVSGKSGRPVHNVTPTSLYIDQWTNRHYTRGSREMYNFVSSVTPFFAEKFISYQGYLTDTFGKDITILDLFGSQGSLMQQILRNTKESQTPVNMYPYMLSSTIFDASIAREILKNNHMDPERAMAITSYHDRNNTLWDNLEILRERKGETDPVVPHAVTVVGKTLEQGIISYQDAVNLVAEIFEILPDEGMLFVGGTDFLVLSKQDFIDLGFEIVEMGNPRSFFDDSAYPKQYYVLRRPAGATRSGIIGAGRSAAQTDDTHRERIEETLEVQPAQDAFDFVLQFNRDPLTLTSPHDGREYTMQLMPKIQIQRPDGSIQMISDLSPETMEASIDGKVHFEIFLKTGDSISLLPVMEGSMSAGLNEFSIDRIMLESVNFKGLLKDLHDLEFTPSVARRLSQLLPEGSTIDVNPALSQVMIFALYQLLPDPKNMAVFHNVTELSQRIRQLRQQQAPTDTLLPELYDGIGILHKELKNALTDSSVIDTMNRTMYRIADIAPAKAFVDAGFSNLHLTIHPTEKKLRLETRKRKPITSLITKGSLRHGLIQSLGADVPENATDTIRSKLLEIQEQLVIQHKVTDEFFRSISFHIVQGPKTEYALAATANTIVLNYELFRDIPGNRDLLVMEIEKGLQRLQIQQLQETTEISPINESTREFYLLLHQVQTFIDIRLKALSLDQGIERQNAVLHIMEQDLDTEDRALMRLFRYVYDNEIESAWVVRDMIMDLIAGAGQFAGTSIYPPAVARQLRETANTVLFNEIDRIMQLQEYGFIKEIVTKSRTSKFSLNIRSHKEKTIKEINQGNDVQVAYLKIQNFKDVFNSFGNNLNLGHFLGDVGIFVISRILKEELENHLKTHGVTVHIGNAGGEFFITFANVGDTDIAGILEEILVPTKSLFKQQIIAETETALIDFVGADTFEPVKDQFRAGFTAEKIHFYGGLSEITKPSKADADSPVESRRLRLAQYAALATDKMYEQAFRVAKHQQLQFSDAYDTVRQNAQYLKDSDESDQAGLARLFDPVVKSASKKMASGIMRYTAEAAQEIQENLNLGLLTEYQLFHRPIAPTYQDYTSLESLSDSYLEAIEKQMTEDVLGEFKDRIVETVLRYKSPNLRGEEFIYEGNENFKRIINFCISHSPDYDIDLTFRLGGDEYGKLVWDPASRILHIYRLDGNNVGATTFEWGIDIGDKLIDESLRIIAETRDMTKLQENITGFFNDMNGRAIELTDQELESMRSKVPSLLVIEEENYRILKNNGTFFDFTRNNAAVIIRTQDDRLELIKFPDIHVPYTIQKDSLTFNYETLPPDPQFETAVPVTFLIGDTAVDFTISKDTTGNVILTSNDPRVTSRHVIPYQDIKTGKQKSIPVTGIGQIDFQIQLGYRNNVTISGDILTLREHEFQRVKLSANKIISKDGKLAVMVTSRPVVSTGYIGIDAKKIDPKYYNKEISVIQGRADSAAEAAKERTKLFQVLHNGTVRNDFTFAVSQNQFTATEREMNSFKDIEFSFWDALVSRYIIENPKEKLNRRLEFFLGHETRLQADDIFILSQMYLSNPKLLDNFQKTMLLYRLMGTFDSFADYETKHMVQQTVLDILTNSDREVWEAGVTVFLGLLPQKPNDISPLFQELIKQVTATDIDPAAVTYWDEHSPATFHEWVKALIDRRQTDMITQMHTMQLEDLEEYAEFLDLYLPLAQQYREFYASGKIASSAVNNNQNHTTIFDRFSLHSKERLEQAYNFALKQVNSVLKQLVTWKDISQDERRLITAILTGNRIIEDSVSRIFSTSIKLGNIQNIHIAQGPTKTVRNDYYISVELIDGTRLEPFVLSIYANLLHIRPPELRQYHTTEALHQYVQHAGTVAATDDALHAKAGSLYTVRLANGVSYDIVTMQKTDERTSKNLFDEAAKEFRDDKLRTELTAIATKDIIAYMRAWDALGRNLFFQFPTPKNIHAGTNIRSLLYLDADVSASQMLKRFSEGYGGYIANKDIFHAIITFFQKYDLRATAGGYQFLLTAYAQIEAESPLKKELFAFLKERLDRLNDEIASHTSIPYDLFVESVRISRTISPQQTKSSYFNDALNVLEERISLSKSVSLNFSLLKFLVRRVAGKEQLPTQEKALLEQDVLQFFINHGYNPLIELKRSLIKLSERIRQDENDYTQRALIDRIESLETLLGIKNPDTYTSITQHGRAYTVHPYAAQIPVEPSHLGSMPPQDALQFLDQRIKDHFLKSDKPFTISFSGRDAAGKIEALEFILGNTDIISPEDVAILKLEACLAADGTVDTDKLEQELAAVQNKKIIFVYGRDVLLRPQVTSRISFDYNLFIESDEATSIKRLLHNGDTRALSRTMADNILNRWGTSFIEQDAPLIPHGIDTQRAQADLIVDMSDPESSQMRYMHIWEPETIIEVMSPSLNDVSRQRILQYINSIKQAFHDDVTRKHIGIFEPSDPALVVALAMMGLHVTAAAADIQKIPLSMEDKYRIKVAGGSITYTDPAIRGNELLWKHHSFDILLIENLKSLIKTQEQISHKSFSEVLNNMFATVRYNGIVMFAPASEKRFIFTEVMLDNTRVSDITPQLIDSDEPLITANGLTVAVLRKLIPENQLIEVKMPVDTSLVNAIQQSADAIDTRHPTIIAIDFDDIVAYSSHWDAFVLITALKKKQEYYDAEDIPVQFAFVSTRATSHQIRSFLRITERTEASNFLLIGNEDIHVQDYDPEEGAAALFAHIPKRLAQLSRFYNPNIVLLESNPERARHAISANSIVLDISSLVSEGLFVDEILEIQSFLEATLLDNKIDQTLLVSHASTSNPLYPQIDQQGNQPVHLHDLIDQPTVSFQELRGLVIIPDSEPKTPRKLKRTFNQFSVIEQSL